MRKMFFSSRGMTLMEIMIVLAIIALIGGVLGRGIFKRLASAKVKTTQMQIRTIEDALEEYHLDNGSYPSSLRALIEKPAGAKRWAPDGYLSGPKGIKDPFSCEFQYRTPGTSGRKYDVYSLGEKCEEGGDGSQADIFSIDVEDEE